MSDEPTQADKFREAARDLECDLDEEAFDRALGRIAKASATESDPLEPSDEAIEWWARRLARTDSDWELASEAQRDGLRDQARNKLRELAKRKTSDDGV